MKYSLDEAIKKRRIILFTNGPKLVSKELGQQRKTYATLKIYFLGVVLNPPQLFLTMLYFILHVPFYIKRNIEKRVIFN